jgi:hypothetical protein
MGRYNDGFNFAKCNGELNNYSTLQNQLKSDIRGMIPSSYFEYEYQDMIKKDKCETED